MSPLRRGHEPTRPQVLQFLDDVAPNADAAQRLRAALCWIYHDAWRNRRQNRAEVLVRAGRYGLTPERFLQIVSGDFTGVSRSAMDGVLRACEAASAEVTVVHELFDQVCLRPQPRPTAPPAPQPVPLFDVLGPVHLPASAREIPATDDIEWFLKDAEDRSPAPAHDREACTRCEEPAHPGPTTPDPDPADNLDDGPHPAAPARVPAPRRSPEPATSGVAPADTPRQDDAAPPAASTSATADNPTDRSADQPDDPVAHQAQTHPAGDAPGDHATAADDGEPVPADGDEDGDGDGRDFQDPAPTGQSARPAPVREPAPEQATTVAEFVAAMKLFKKSKGDPPLRDMAKAVKQDPTLRDYSFASFSTIGNNGKLPKNELVRAYIAGAGGSRKQQERWDRARTQLAMRLADPPP